MNDAKLPDLRQNGLLLNSSSKFMNLLSRALESNHSFTRASEIITGILFMAQVINPAPTFIRFLGVKFVFVFVMEAYGRAEE